VIAIRFKSEKGSTNPQTFTATEQKRGIDTIDAPVSKKPIPLKKEVQPAIQTANKNPGIGKTIISSLKADSVLPININAIGQVEIKNKGLAEIKPTAENSHLYKYRIWVYYPSDIPVSGTKKRTLSYKFLKATRTMLATLNLPSLSIKTKTIKGKFIPAFDIKVQLPLNENNILANYNE
jgi:hypothetical protein